jgi:serralysin
MCMMCPGGGSTGYFAHAFNEVSYGGGGGTPDEAGGAGRAVLLNMTTVGGVNQFSGNRFVDATLIGSKWNTQSLTYAFPTDGTPYGQGYTFTDAGDTFAFNNAQAVAALTAMAEIASFTNLTFTAVSGADMATAHLRFANTTDTTSTPSAKAHFPSTLTPAGDVWFGDSGQPFYDNPQRGNWGFATQFHELGHAMGLKHGHQDYTNVNLGSYFGVQTRFGSQAQFSQFDGQAWSLMSYTPAPGKSGFQGDEFNQPQSYMMSDIAALQFLYGANFNTRSDNTVYTFSTTTGDMFANGVSLGAPNSNRIFRTVWDGNGVDTYNLSNYTTNLSIDLRPGAYSNFGMQLVNHTPLSGTATTALGNLFNPILFNNDLRSLIENAVGGTGNDTIRGNQGSNYLFGGAGNDTLIGEDGVDNLEGGAGADTLIGAFNQANGDGTLDFARYDNATGGLVISLANPNINTGEAAGDVYWGIEGIVGTRFNDVIYGDGSGNTLVGGAGIDQIFGQGANDQIDGGTGDDFLYGGLGADYLNGGDGFDYASYALAAAGLAIFLATPGSSTGEAAGDTYASIDGIIGSNFNDTVGGDGLANTLLGGNGHDVVFGFGGDDSLYGDAGDDSLIGGLGADYHNGGSGFDYARYDFATAGVVLFMTDPNAGGGEAFGDLLVAIEGVLGSNFGDTLSGTALNDTLLGGGGNDMLFGWEGTDALYGGGGDDQLFGGLGADYLFGDVNFDYARYDYATSAVAVNLAGTGFGGEAFGDSYVAVEGVVGSSFGDYIVGDGASNVLSGSLGDDIIVGGAGGDGLYGGDGVDTLYGQAGNDSLHGGDGIDFFMFARGEGPDQVLDFSSSVDKIGLQASTFGSGLTAGGSLNGRFAYNAANSAQGQFVFDTSNNTLYWDSNGTGAGGLEALAVLQAGAALTQNDLVLF